MKVITFALQKGGVGKTSISVSVAVALAQNNYRVLLIDSDPQGNATTWLDIQEMNLELADVLMRKCSVKEAILPTKVKNLSIIPTAALGSELRVYSKREANERPMILRRILREIKDDFDYVIIDTSNPSIKLIAFVITTIQKTENIFKNISFDIIASDEAITVLNIDEFSTDGLITFHTNIESLADRHDTDKVFMNKIILNGRDFRLSQQNDYVQKITNSSDFKFYIIPVDQSFKKAQSIHFPIQFLTETKK